MSETGTAQRGRLGGRAGTFFICTVLFIIGLLPVLIVSKGAYIYSGDYNYQILPFWRHMHNVYREGFVLFDWTSDIGYNYIGGYAFYGLFSPYTLLSLIFPESLLPYGITLINALKFGVAGLGAHIYCRQYLKSDRSAQICGILYAFSGAQLYDMVFHFSDTISLFPFVLYSLDRLIKDNRRAGFAVILAVAGVTNYYLFFGICVFLVLYFLVKVICGEYVLTVRSFLCVAFEAAAGLLLTAAVLLPAFYQVQSIARAGNSISGSGLLLYDEPMTIPKLIASIFFVPDRCMYGFFTDSSALNSASVTLYIPLFSAVLALSTVRRSKRAWFTVLTGVCFIFSVVPVLNSAFSAFNSTYYARWTYMPLLIMIMMTGRALDSFEELDLKRELTAVGIATAAFTLYGVYRIIAQLKTDAETASGLGETGRSGGGLVLPTGDRVFILLFSAVCLLLLAVLRYRPFSIISPKRLTGITAVMCCLPFFYYAANHPYMTDYYTESAVRRIYNEMQPLSIEDDGFFRTVSVGHDSSDAGIGWELPTVELYSSGESGKVTSFYARIAQRRYSHPLYLSDEYALFSFFSVKYEARFNDLMVGGIEVEPEHIRQERPGFELSDVQNRYVIYRNEGFVPMGFTFDYYLPLDEMEPVTFDDTDISCDKEESFRREKLLLKAIWLTDEQIARYSDILEELPEELKSDTSDEAYFADCENRRGSAAYLFEPDGTGFTSKIRLDKDSLVFYSIPCDGGFTAYVDGEKTPIEDVYDGLSAVYVPAGEHTVRFDYMPAGLRAGLIISGSAAAALMIYWLAGAAIKKRSRAAQK
ncbi:MAG: YfhO family protein [Ruminococcus sp.]|nr:YfhO family protein [Ruminococcus sp.]